MGTNMHIENNSVFSHFLGQDSSSKFKYYELFLTEGKNTANPLTVRRYSILLQKITK